MEEQIKKVGRRMSIYMAVVLSFSLSLIGMVSAGKFTVVGFLISFLISTVISIIIGIIVPMKKLNDSVAIKSKIKSKLGQRLLITLVSDCIFTPVMTLAMVGLAHRMAVSQGATIPFLPMFLKSLIISMLAGYVIIFIATPLCFKFAMRGIPTEGPKPNINEQPRRNN
ncbi:MAG: hypothetical protein K6G63_10945 [Eubacterium sp.]|nr:hypothetical protein [Eubacterium sp.]